MGAPRAAQSFSQPARSAAISCIGAYRQYKLCNTNVSTLPTGLHGGCSSFPLGGSEHVEDGKTWLR